ncbi:hypothetical protein PUN28_012498 [Cardiocondyla obscurior]|uniref:Uncharacterized protein n=1 Tax=Cardiocondyla obscurior TaxID=286306 RepID=A0AAW2FF34_9HYME
MSSRRLAASAERDRTVIEGDLPGCGLRLPLQVFAFERGISEMLHFALSKRFQKIASSFYCRRYARMAISCIVNSIIYFCFNPARWRVRSGTRFTSFKSRI